MDVARKVAFALRKRADVHERAGCNNDPDHEESATELARAVVRDEFLEMARFIEDGLGDCVYRPYQEDEYEKLKNEQDKNREGEKT